MKNSVIVTLLIGYSFFAQAQEVGLQLYSLRNQFKQDVPNTLGLINEWGISKIEGGGTYGLSIDAFKQLLVENELDVVSVGASFEELESEVEKVIANAKTFGATYVMCAWVPHDDNKWDLEETQHATNVSIRLEKF